jgi:hypothetical protein
MSIQVIANPLPEEGRTIFMSRCAACHSVNKQLTGPALAGVHERRSIDWIINFVHSSQKVIKNGDKDALALYQKFNRITMPDHPDLTNDNIQSIVEFIKAESQSVSATNAAPFEKPDKLRPNFLPLSINNYGVFFTYFGLVALLIVVMLFMVRVKEYERIVTKNNVGTRDQ